MSKPKTVSRAKATANTTTSKSHAFTEVKRERTSTKQLVDRSRPTARPDTKLGNMINLLRRREGATIEQMMKTTGWQAHSVRGAMSGALKKRLGLNISSSESGGVRTYRIVAAGKG